MSAARDGTWVLVTEGTDGESRAAVAAVRALHASGYDVAVTECGRTSLAAASRYCRRRVRVPHAVEDPAGYARAVRDELATRPYLAVLPASDASLIALDAPVRGLIDKAECRSRAQAAGLSTPPTQLFPSRAELLRHAAGLAYPVVVKPALKRSAVVRIGSEAELLAVPDPGTPLVVQPFLAEQMRGVVGLSWHGSLAAAVHMRYLRIWPLPCGTVAAAETVAGDPRIEEGLAALLSGYDGIFHADFVGPHLVDVNPRIHASLPLARAAGVDLVSLYCDALRGREVGRVRGTAGARFRHLEGDVRSVAWNVRRGNVSPREALAALRPRRGTVHSYGSWRDPGPSAARMRLAARRLLRGATAA